MSTTSHLGHNLNAASTSVILNHGYRPNTRSFNQSWSRGPDLIAALRHLCCSSFNDLLCTSFALESIMLNQVVNFYLKVTLYLTMHLLGLVYFMAFLCLEQSHQTSTLPFPYLISDSNSSSECSQRVWPMIFISCLSLQSWINRNISFKDDCLHEGATTSLSRELLKKINWCF